MENDLQKRINDLESIVYNHTHRGYDRTPTLPDVQFAFGGSGEDNILSVTSGTTTIDLGSAEYVEKNYSFISIDSGATLAFSNPATKGTVVVLKSRGDVTIAGTITANFGAAGGVCADSSDGTVGSDSDEIIDVTDAQNATFYGLGGLVHLGGGDATNRTGAAASGTIPATNLYTTDSGVLYQRSFRILPGAGGGGGGAGGTGNTGGAGGRGGGALYIECGGKWTFTGTINVNGTAGTAGASSSAVAAGGGGGGGGGMLFVLYDELGSNTGTVTKAGGAGGAGDSGSGAGNGGASGGSGGAGVLGAGGAGGDSGTAANVGSAGSNGAGSDGGTGGAGGAVVSGAGGGGGGGGGGSGSSVIAINYWI